MTTREPERDPAARPEPDGESAQPDPGNEQQIRADRIMHPDQAPDAESDHVDDDASTSADPSPAREEAAQEPSPVSDDTTPGREGSAEDPSPHQEPRGDSVTATRSDTAPRDAADTGADDRTQTLPAADDTTDRTADTDKTQVIGTTDDRHDDDRATDEDRGGLDRTRPMPVVSDTATERSTDREAARARAEARRRPMEDTEPAPAVAPQPAPAPAPAAAAERRVVVRNRRHITDRFDGAVAMFILRLVTAAIMGTWGVQMLMNLSATRDFFGKTMLPYPHWAALVTAVACVLIALALIIGLLVRVAGLGVLLIAVGSLVFVTWAPFHLFVKGQNGFAGQFELLLAAVGLLFLLIGGGGWGADRMFRSNKSKGLPDVEDDEDDVV